MGFHRGSLVATVLTETHAHLDFPDLAGQIDSVLQRAAEAGVRRIITIGIDGESCDRALALAEKYDDVFAVVGLHPCSVMDGGAMDFLEQLPDLAAHPKVVALGEMGMDYHHLPSREMAGKNEEAVFDGSPEEVAEIAAMGHLVSFTGIVTFKNAALVQQSAQTVAAHGYMVETDCPYLAPVPHRGKTCEPAYLPLIVEKIAGLRRITLEQVAAETEETANRFFRFEDT